MKRCIVGLAAWRKLAAMALALIVSVGCADQAAGPAAATPSPTIAAPPARPSPTLAVPVTPSPPRPSPSATPPPVVQPSATPPAGSSVPPSPTAPPAPFAYLWPTYLPPNMHISPSESRVAGDDEIGQSGLGFFIVTFTDGTAKLVIGGGATETLPLTGEQRRITVGGREATLTTNGDQRQLVFTVSRGKLFVYGSSLSEETLLQIASSLQPIEVQDLRALVAAR